MTRQEQYKQYLRSKDWSRKRSRKRARRNRCAICGATQCLDVHHLVYRRWVDVTMGDLRVFCRRCHDLTHQLIAAGVIAYQSNDPAHRFSVTRNALHRVLGPTDMHWPDARKMGDFAPVWSVEGER